MNKPVIILGATTLALAASTLWLALQLTAAHDELAVLKAGSAKAAESPAIALPAAEPAQTTVAPAAAPASVETAKPATAPGSLTDETRARIRASIEANIPRMRETLEDPEKRAEFLRISRANNQRDMPRLDEHLKLTPDEYSRLLDLLARQELQYQKSMYECALDRGCDPMPVLGARHEQATRQELDDLLGPEKAQRFANYKDNWQERRTVTQMRGELSDSVRLTDAQADKLIDMLGEERRRIVSEWQQEGGDAAGMGNQYGFVSHSTKAQSLEEFQAQATELQRRQRERAARFLTAGQLAAFVQQQKYALDMASGGWEYQRELARANAN
jgi:hypothetical protein